MTCPVCAAPIPAPTRGRPRIYCSTACEKRANSRKQVEKRKAERHARGLRPAGRPFRVPEPPANLPRAVDKRKPWDWSEVHRVKGRPRVRQPCIEAKTLYQVEAKR